RARLTESADYYLGTTADQIAARQLGRGTQLPSLELAMDLMTLAGQCDNGYACVYQNNLSWSSPTTPLPSEAHPPVLFHGPRRPRPCRPRLPGGSCSSGSSATAAPRPNAARPCGAGPACSIPSWKSLPSSTTSSARPTGPGSPSTWTPSARWNAASSVPRP